MATRTRERGRGVLLRPSGRARRTAAALLAATALAPALPAGADAWVFEPSVSLDQRFDDNYRLEPGVSRGISATRGVVDVGLSRESQTVIFRGALRADALLSQGNYQGNALDSNQVLFLDSSLRDELTTWSVGLSFKRDTPSRDITADLSDPGSTALDEVATQRSDVARRRFVLAPSVSRELTRRARVEATITLTDVAHGTPSASDAIYERYIALYAGQNQPGAANPNVVPEAADGGPLSESEVVTRTPQGEVTSAQPELGVFTPSGELDDYRELKTDLAYRYALSPISTASVIAGYSYYVADVEATDVRFEDLSRDPASNIIYRRPRGRDSLSTTTSLRLGYDRDLTETLRVGTQVGVYRNTSDETDVYRPTDRPDIAFDPMRRDALKTSEDGWLANVTLTKDAGLTRYSARFAIDVQPSSIGTQVQTQELIGDVYRTLTPLLDTSLRVRFYEPDRLGANPNDAFARRFLSVEPRLGWRFSRAWTASTGYRYRRQKSRAEPDPAESNAILFALTYTPPSAIRDAAAGR